MVLVDERYFGELTYKAQEWQSLFDERAEEALKRLYPVVLADIMDDIMSILQKELERALGIFKEYQRYQWMSKELLRKIVTPEVVLLDRETGTIWLRDGIERVAGSKQDYMEGVWAVREQLAEDGESQRQLSPLQRYNFWKNVVYPSEYHYSRTMAARRRAWGDLTPWWVWLDEGNQYPLAYPSQEGTNFVDFAQHQARELFDARLEELEIEVDNVITRAYRQFMRNPEAFQPFDVLETFYERGRAYEVYVTETGRVGARLQ
jgi:hypothetical protein